MSGFWRASSPLVLASRSASRRALLEAAGIPLEIVPADVDERAIEARLGACAPQEVAQALAIAKALAVATHHRGRIVLGSDQVMALGPVIIHKATTRAEAAQTLARLRGHTHELHSACALVRDGVVAWQTCVSARLTMRPFDDAFLARYVDAAGDAVLSSVGGYQLEALGVHLFEHLDGEHTTILGLPLLPVLAALRALEALA